MSAGNSFVEVAYLIDFQNTPTLMIVASDVEDGIQEIKVWSKHGRVPLIVKADNCPKQIVEHIRPYPKDWFPVTVDIVDCQKENGKPKPATDRHGPYETDGSSAKGNIEKDVNTPPGPFIPKPPPIQGTFELPEFPEEEAIMNILARYEALKQAYLISGLTQKILTGSRPVQYKAPQINFEIIDDTIQEEQEEECNGDCVSTAIAWRLADGECPDPCDPTRTAEVAKTAKKKARGNAIQKCLNKNEDCICADGSYFKWAEGCVPAEDPGGNNLCMYYALYTYKGKCKPIP